MHESLHSRHAGHAHAASEFLHFVGGLFLSGVDSLLDALENEVLQELGVFGIDDGRIDGNGEDNPLFPFLMRAPEGILSEDEKQIPSIS